MARARRFLILGVISGLLGMLTFGTPGISCADRARLIADPDDALQVRVDLIQQAHHEILVEYFAVANDDPSAGGIALLLDAARRGVKVKVVLDALANKVPTHVLAAIKKMSLRPDGSPGIDVRVYNGLGLNPFKLTKRDHSKMIIVDGQRLLTGGRNIGDKYFHQGRYRQPYDDLDVLIDGKAVLEARKNFLETWDSRLLSRPFLGRHSDDELSPSHCLYLEGNQMGCEQEVLAHQREVTSAAARIERLLSDILKPQPDDIVKSNTGTDWLKNANDVGRIRFLSPSPKRLVSRRTAFLTKSVLKLLKNAKKEIQIVSPYVVMTRETLAIFSELRARGVNILIVTNSLRSIDGIFAYAGYRYRRADLIKMGVEIHEYVGPNTLHAKALAVDDRVSSVGSYNFDPRSFYLNREVGLAIPDSIAFADDVKKQIEVYKSNSVLVAKDGIEQNRAWREEQDAKSGRAGYVAILKLLMPVLINQL